MGTTILIVDDNRDAADSLADLLRIAGHEVRVAYDAETALSVVQDDPPHAVLIDLGMPRISGLDLLRSLRCLPSMAKAKLACVTGYSNDALRHSARDAGCDAYLLKPANTADVEAMLAQSAPNGARG